MGDNPIGDCGLKIDDCHLVVAFPPINRQSLHADGFDGAGIDARAAIDAAIGIDQSLAIDHADGIARTLVHTRFTTGTFALIHFGWPSESLSMLR